VRAANVELPMISTELTAMTNPTAYAVLALANQGAVPMFRTGYWSAHPGGAVEQQLAEVRREIAGLLMLARRCNIAAMFPNRAGDWAGHSVREAQTLVGDMDPRWIGYYFDVAAALADGGTDQWERALGLALPRIKAVAVSDFKWKQNDQSGTEACPLGAGVVDWTKLFAILAEAHFTGPVSIHRDYVASDAPAAARKDLEFIRSRIQQAYAAGQKS
jgi:sugar phosphate isomerase/epimerase